MSEVLDVRTFGRDELTEPSQAGERARALAPKLKALADENRLTLVLLLAERPRTVRELTDDSGLTQTLVSHHLAFLRDQDLVSITPRGRANIYALCCDELAQPVRLLASLAALTPEGADACCTDPPGAA